MNYNNISKFNFGDVRFGIVTTSRNSVQNLSAMMNTAQVLGNNSFPSVGSQNVNDGALRWKSPPVLGTIASNSIGDNVKRQLKDAAISKGVINWIENVDLASNEGDLRNMLNNDNIHFGKVGYEVWIDIGSTRKSTSSPTTPVIVNNSEAASIRFEYSNGIVESVTSVVEDDGGVRVVISDLTRNRDWVNVRYRKSMRNSGWELEVNQEFSDDVVPSSTTLTEFCIATWSSYYVQRARAAQLIAESEFRDDAKDGKKNEGRSLQASQGCSCCIAHDMVCTDPFHSGALVVKVQIPGRGWRVVDLKSCCVRHDSGYFCAEELVSKLTVDLALSLCVMAKVMQLFVNETPWYFGGVVTGAILGAAWGALIAAFFLTAVTFALSFRTSIFGWFGANRKCCACGGKQPTFRSNCRSDTPEEREQTRLDEANKTNYICGVPCR
ncbi:MAG: hypothetical protein JWQ98_2701 [Chlorobi bacterium]|nr:hypothetical protein [Chlorobiota bacterium]